MSAELDYIDHKADPAKRELPPYRLFQVIIQRDLAEGTQITTEVAAHGVQIHASGALTFGELFFNPYRNLIDQRNFRTFAPGEWLECREVTRNVSSGSETVQ